MTRTFKSTTAVRANVPLLIALIGPSGGGKTFSALRLATGIQRVQPGEIDVVDTEAGRALHYADQFKFRHTNFEPPFGSLDYLDVIQHCVKNGARTVIIDSMSHEHEGTGGMLDLAQQIIEEKIARKVHFKDLPSADCHQADKERDKLKIGSFIVPKANRSKLINGILQLHCNVIMCFRAKEKVKPKQGGAPDQLGWMPIGGDEFWYEMTARALLLPGANGVPEWNPQHDGEKMAARRPKQFSEIMGNKQQLSEDMGEKMARWAAGSGVAPAPIEPPESTDQWVCVDLSDALAHISGAATLAQLKLQAGKLRAIEWGSDERDAIAKAITARQAELKAGT